MTNRKAKGERYADMRNRVTVTGEEWLGPEAKEAFSAKLCRINRKYPFWKRYQIDHQK